MAFDGLTVASVVSEISRLTPGTRIYKISQPEEDELLLTVKGNSNQFRLLISADATLPLVYITEENKPSPMTAPNFCMMLRKHLTNAKIISVTQPGLERIIKFELEHLNEMGDVCRKYLIVELMGKYSNIIFTDQDGMIIDAIKHISHNVSSLREVLPGRQWFIPESLQKKDALNEDIDGFMSTICNSPMSFSKAIYSAYTGISPLVAQEICYRAGIDGDTSTSSIELMDNLGEGYTPSYVNLWNSFSGIINDVKKGVFTPQIYYNNNSPREYGVISFSIYADMTSKTYDSISELLQDYYREKSIVVRIRQKSQDLRKITQTALERNVKKLDLQKKQLEDTEKKDKYRIYGELINTYGYSVKEGSKSFEAVNYYNNETVTIPLDPAISVMENGKRYFDKYGKLKRTAQSLTGIIEEVSREVDELQSIMTALDMAVYEEDLHEIKEELIAAGYIKYKANGKKKEKITSKPFHFISSDGFDIYVGKNNLQNDKLTFDFANGNDWWFHTKKLHGSHVIVRSENKEVPDSTFEEAARLAAHFSEGKMSDRVEVDYTIRKNVKKPQGAKPGFVVYYTNYSMVIDSDISNIKRVDERK